MGYRCPACHKDFGCDKKTFNKHIKKEHNGAVDMFVKKLMKMTSNKKNRKKIKQIKAKNKED